MFLFTFKLLIAGFINKLASIPERLKMIIGYALSTALNIHSAFSKNLSPLMIFCFGLAWKAFAWFPYMFLAASMAFSVQIRVEVDLN